VRPQKRRRCRSILPKVMVLDDEQLMFLPSVVAFGILGELLRVGSQLLSDKIKQIGWRTFIQPQWPAGVTQQTELNRVSQAIVFTPPLMMRVMSSCDKNQ
jgi:hypothetical protein